jgi:transposase
MRDGLFWLNDRQWARIESHLPTGLTGPERDDDRHIISGIIHMLQSGARWRDCPGEYGPYTTIYNRFNRWAKRGRWGAIFEALAQPGKDGLVLSLETRPRLKHHVQHSPLAIIMNKVTGIVGGVTTLSYKGLASLL